MKIKTALILCAGYGKRLLPLTEDIPKPLLKVKNINLLDNTLEFLQSIGISKIKINTDKNAIMRASLPDLIESSPNDGPTVRSSIILMGAGSSPALNTFAISLASLALSSPLINVCPVGI